MVDAGCWVDRLVVGESDDSLACYCALYFRLFEACGAQPLDVDGAVFLMDDRVELVDPLDA
jgi:hypothetical protein